MPEQHYDRPIRGSVFSIVFALGAAMHDKLYRKQMQRWDGWQYMTEDALWERIEMQMAKDVRDPVDIANFCAMILARRERDSEEVPDVHQ